MRTSPSTRRLDEVKAQRFLTAVAQRLGLTTRHLFAAYEDAFYYLWRERQLPANVDPFDSKLEDPLERERLAKVFSSGLDQVIGHVLPMHGVDDEGWQTGSWFLRTERCYLVPGDSPVGYRLPRDSQPWVKNSDYPFPVSARSDSAAAATGSPRAKSVSRCSVSTHRLTNCPAATERGEVRIGPLRRVIRPYAVTRSPRASRRQVNRPTGSRAPRCAPSRVTACSISSCRRLSSSSTISNW